MHNRHDFRSTISCQELLKMKLIYTTILATLLGIVQAVAQDQPLFHSVDEQDGLASDQISCLAVDDYGYLWIGFPSALSRYDGRHFKLYSSSPENRTNIVVGNAIAHINKDQDGNMWFASEKGVSYFCLTTSKFTYLPLYDKDKGRIISNYQADKIYVNSRNEIYTFNPINLLCKYNKEKQYIEPVFEGIFKDTHPQNCCMDNDDNFWFLNETTKTITRVSSKGEIMLEINCDDYHVDNVCKNHYGFLDNGNGEYWFGGNFGIYIWDTKINNFKRLEAANSEIFPNREIKCIYKDSRGIIWIGTNALETFYYDPSTKKYTMVPHAKSRTQYKLNSPTIIDICEDSRGLLWFGTWKGLSFTEQNPTKQFHNISNDNKILGDRNYINAFDTYGNMVAIGCDGGGITFWKKDDANATAHFAPDDTPQFDMETGSALAAAYDRDGYLYNGGYNRSIMRIHPNMKDADIYKIDTKDPHKLQHDFTSCILCDSQNRIWILSNGGGLCQLTDPEKGTVEYHNTDSHGMPHSGNCGTALAEYDDHTLLVGSYIGFSVYDTRDDVFTTYRSIADDTTTLSHNWVYAFCVDSKKRIWIGTCSGFNRFDINTGQFQRYGRECGLLSDVIKGILEDEETGLLWISTAKGISKFDPESGKVLRTYLASDGLLSENFMIRGAHKAADGTMYFGMANGFTYFRPEEIRDVTHMPEPTITGMLINYNRVTPQDSLSPLKKAPEAIDKIVLNFNQSTFTIEFTSLNFVNEGGNQYAYKMEGFNKDWVDIGTRHEVTFTNLDQGEYTFLVKCRNSDGITSGIRPLKVIIRPPFYRTWWFISITMLLILGITLLYMRMRTRSMKERQAKLENTVKERTEALMNVNKALEEQKEEIEKSLNNTLILNDLSRQITSSFDVPNIVYLAFSHIKMMCRMEFFAMGIFSQSKNTLEFNYIRHGFAEQEPLAVPISSNTAETKCFSCTEDQYLTGGQCAGSVFRNIEGEPFGTLFILPIHEASHINGVLVVGCMEPNKYTKTDRANLRMITSYLSIALEKAKDYHQLRIKNNAINGSIRYAKTIQDAILAHEEEINRYFNAMIIFRPKDIVSGDFYWFKTIGGPRKPNMIFAAVIDCTGHGVPGAFMSLISNILLNDIIIRNANYEPNAVLSALHKEIMQSLNQTQNLNDDGLDMALCRFDIDSSGQYSRVVYAGAKNSLYHYHSRTGEIEIYAADRLSIGGYNNAADKVFTNHIIEANTGDMFYMTSDGIIDQNNKERKRFGRKKLMETISRYHEMDMKDQKTHFQQTLDTYMDGEEQRDDITVMGLKII